MNDSETRSTRLQKRRRSSVGNRESPVKSQKTSSPKALIVDNGAYTIKIGYVEDAEPKVIPNCIMKAKSERKRLFVGQQIEECRDCSGLYYLLPCEKGYITRWEVQKPVWDHVFSKNVYPIEDNPVILTQPLFNFKSIQDCIDEIFFEEYEVSSLFRCSPPDLTYLNFAKHKLAKNDACLVVDTGFSFTHVVPYVVGNKFLRGIRRINVGGKLLTNHLKDIISYRQYNVMEETYVINQVKEDTCYVSRDIKKDLIKAAEPYKLNSIVKNYVLPDFNQIRRGFIQDNVKIEPNDEDNYQILRLNNERFIVPEILFHPSDIGIKSMGIAEAIVDSIMACPQDQRQSLAKNIIVVGGNCKFPGFKDRLYADLRSLMPVEWPVKLYQPEDPITYPWKGGGAFLKTPDFRSHLVTKQDYEELGSGIIQEKFNNFMSNSSELDVGETSNDIKNIEYLPGLTADVLGKQELLLPVNEDDDKMEVDEDNEEIDESSTNVSMAAEDVDSEKGVTRRGRKAKVIEEENVQVRNTVEDEYNIFENREIFPFDISSYF